MVKLVDMLAKLSGLSFHEVECALQSSDKMKNCYSSIAIELNSIAVEMYKCGEYKNAEDLYKMSIQTILRPINKETLTQSLDKYVFSKDMLKQLKHKQNLQTNVINREFYSSKYNVPLLSSAIKFPENQTSFQKEEYCILMLNMSLVYLQLGFNSVAKEVLEFIMNSTRSTDLNLSIINALGYISFMENELEDALKLFFLGRIEGMLIAQDCMIDAEKDQKVFRHLSTFSSNIGRIYFVTGRYEEAMSECMQLLDDTKSFLGYDHVTVCVTLYNLGLINQVQNKIEKANEFYNCFRSHPKILSKQQFCTQDIITAFLNILQIDFGLENMSFSKVLKETQKIRNELGQENPLVPRLLRNIGKLLLINFLFELALPFFFEELRVEQNCYGFHYHNLASTMYFIGKSYQGQHNSLEAKRYFKKALTFMKERNMKGLTYGLSLYEIGLINFGNSVYSTAMNQFKEAFDELKVVFGEYHSLIAEMKQAIARMMLDHGKVYESFNMLLEALMIIRMAHGNNHHKVAELLYLIGNLHQLKGEDNDALNSYDQSFQVQIKINQAREILAVKTQNKIAVLHRKRGEIDNAIIALEIILDILYARLGKVHMCVASLFNQIGRVYLENGMTQESNNYFAKAQYLIKKIKNSCLQPMNNDFENEISLIVVKFYTWNSPATAPVA